MHKTMHNRYLNQIYGRTFPSWKITPSIVKISGECYYQCRQGPNLWLLQTSFLKASDTEVKLTKPIVDQWRNHKDYYCKDYYAHGCNAVGLLTGSKRLSQFNRGKVLVTYTLKQKSYGGYMWMPLPGSPCFSQDFALITLEQKQVVDNYFFDPDNHTMPLMDPEQFRRWMINLSSENGVDSFVRLTNL